MFFLSSIKQLLAPLIKPKMSLGTNPKLTWKKECDEVYSGVSKRGIYKTNYPGNY